MAIYHLTVNTIGRSAGRSATAAAAYRSGAIIACERTGQVHDYTRRRGVEHTEIILPENAPEWATDRAMLWNAAEQSEKRRNSTVAREFEVALPDELNREHRLELVREFSRDLVQRHSMAVDIAIHTPGKKGDHQNHHAHLLCTTRRITPDGFGDKTRELDEKKRGEVKHWREQWEKISNRHLEKAGHQARIDHRSLKDQGIDRIPQIHLGVNVIEMERRGIRTGRKALWRDIDKCNAEIIDLQAARETIEKQIKEEQEELERQARARAEREKTAQEARERAEREKVEREREISPAVLEWEKRQRAARECEQEKAAKAAQKRLERDPRAVEQAWVAEKLQQYAQIKPRVVAASRRAEGQLDRQAAKGKDHEKSRPEEPQGLFARLKTRDYKRKLAVWKVEESQIQARERQLETRLKRLGDLWAVRDLVAKKAAQTKPRLAGLFEKVLKKEEQEKKIEQERLETERRWKEREKADQERRRVELEKAKEAELEKAAQFKLREAQEQPKRIDFDVPYDDQAVAETLGARWDRDAKTWFISGEQVANSAFWRWHSYRPFKQERERSRGIDDDFDIGF